MAHHTQQLKLARVSRPEAALSEIRQSEEAHEAQRCPLCGSKRAAWARPADIHDQDRDRQVRGICCFG
jgi:DNA-directed RNA polymerase subunit RPC12/RpoP